jgi:hypothetical protein
MADVPLRYERLSDLILVKRAKVVFSEAPA